MRIVNNVYVLIKKTNNSCAVKYEAVFFYVTDKTRQGWNEKKPH